MVLGDLQPNFRSLGRRSGSSSWMWVSTSGSVVFSTGKTFKVDFAAGRETYRCRAVKRCAVGVQGCCNVSDGQVSIVSGAWRGSSAPACDACCC